jgi:DNA-directed RNA polymerase subunit H (RpoH/RPB5)
MDTALRELVVRGRPVLLDILAMRGYDAAPYAAETPDEARRKAATDALGMEVQAAPDGGAARARCLVRYWLDVRSKQQLQKNLDALWSEPATAEEGAAPPDPATCAVLVVLGEEGHLRDAAHAAALGEWRARGASVTLLPARQTLLNPARHRDVPPHRRLREGEVKAQLARLKVRGAAQLPHILFHEDPMARALGLLPGDVVEIRRPSPTAGECCVYRVCVEK